MIGLIVTLMLFVGVPLLFGARSRVSRLEYRLRLVEEELRRRIAAGREVLHNEPPPVAAARAAMPERAPEPQPQPAPEPIPTPPASCQRPVHP